ncbi:hypothetical protein F5B19DRAFT_324403 [Rostrohypoxylon terebratum]|nr:hypothetical protein F5B19DRAFT_324403 [Rostrohypoxylon terebratum]
MVFRCRSFNCDHEHTSSCKGYANSWKCCECDGLMYKSEVHTPASNCSASTGLCSLGPPESVIAMDDFDRQLKEKLDTLNEDSATYDGKPATEVAARKAADWKKKIDDLLVIDADRPMADPYITDDHMDQSDDEEDARKRDGKLGKPDSSTLLNQENKQEKPSKGQND